MHEDLHLLPQSPQLWHFSVSIAGAKMLKRDTNPSTVPTGQMVLHHVLPFFQASTKITTNVTAATMNVGSERILQY